jgi:hypothetical protein
VNPVAVDVFVPKVTAGVPARDAEKVGPVPPEFTPATDTLCAKVPFSPVNVAEVADVPFLGYVKPPVSVSAAPEMDLNASTLYVVAPDADQLTVKPVAVTLLYVMVGVPGTARVVNVTLA